MSGWLDPGVFRNSFLQSNIGNKSDYGISHKEVYFYRHNYAMIIIIENRKGNRYIMPFLSSKVLSVMYLFPIL